MLLDLAILVYSTDMAMIDNPALYDPTDLIWCEMNEKWSDRGNDFFVSRRDGRWEARARYYFVWPEISEKEYAGEHQVLYFDTEKEACSFLRSYLALRQKRFDKWG